MNELIHIEQRQIGPVDMPSVDARDLHEFLGVQTAFKDWIARRVQEYGFRDGQDFCSFLSESQGGRPARDYFISLDMAKELAMVEKTVKGKEARQYFIECERLVKVGASKPPVRAEGLTSKIRAIEMVAKMVAVVPGVRIDDLLTVKLDMIESETGLPATAFRKALPSVDTAHVKTLNATAIGVELGVSAIKANQIMQSLGLQTREAKGLRLTTLGEKYAKVVPFTRNGHTGTEIQWFESVLDFILESERGAA